MKHLQPKRKNWLTEYIISGVRSPDVCALQTRSRSTKCLSLNSITVGAFSRLSLGLWYYCIHSIKLNFNFKTSNFFLFTEIYSKLYHHSTTYSLKNVATMEGLYSSESKNKNYGGGAWSSFLTTLLQK